MVIYDPDPAEVARSAERRGVRLTLDEARLLVELGRGTFDGCDRLTAEEAFALPSRYPRAAGRRPVRSENPHNAWVWRCDVRGSADGGVLSGQEVAVKDIVPVAGQPMTAGSTVLEGYTPPFDATVVTRILDAGGRITGIATTEDMCLSGASVSAATGQVRNPRDSSRSAGGSSSGIAALVASGQIDSGIGADQGGSIRIPSSLCGVYGLKPTYGLIPYTGCGPIDPSLDHLGPIAGTVESLARLLQAVAGHDNGLDPRQHHTIETLDVLSELGGERSGLRIGVLAEGFGHERLSDPAVDDSVRSLASRIGELGHEIVEVSAPLHRRAMDVHGSLLLQGAAQHMIGAGGVGPIGKGFYDEHVGIAAAGGLRHRGDRLFASVKFAAAIGGYLWDTYGGAFYARAQNVALALRAQYERLLAGVDLLLMPTTCVQAPELPSATVPGLESVRLALDPALISNTCAFNHTGHPALSVPVPGPGGLPVGVMLVGRWFSEPVMLGLARDIERAGLAITTRRAA
ncbi:MAG: amidase family protein [Streptosporangiaceae bacterium]